MEQLVCFIILFERGFEGVLQSPLRVWIFIKW